MGLSAREGARGRVVGRSGSEVWCHFCVGFKVVPECGGGGIFLIMRPTRLFPRQVVNYGILLGAMAR